MAKGNIFLGTASGKVGNLVLSENSLAQNYTDKQIIRAYTANTGKKSTKTYADSVYHQNAHFKASSQFFELVSSVSGHGFQTAKKTVAQNRLAFKSANDVKAAPAYYAVCGAGDDSRFVLAPWILTKGSLLQPRVTYEGEDQNGEFGLGIYAQGWPGADAEDITVRQYSQFLLDHPMNKPYLSDGCQISLMVFRAQPNDPYMNLSFEKYEFTLNLNYQEAPTGAPFDLFEPDTRTSLNIVQYAQTGELHLQIKGDTLDVLGIAVCISKFDGTSRKKIKVSTSQIVLRADVRLKSMQAAAAPFTSTVEEASRLTDDQAYKVVIDTWKPGSGYVDSASGTPTYDENENFLDPNL